MVSYVTVADHPGRLYPFAIGRGASALDGHARAGFDLLPELLLFHGLAIRPDPGHPGCIALGAGAPQVELGTTRISARSLGPDRGAHGRDRGVRLAPGQLVGHDTHGFEPSSDGAVALDHSHTSRGDEQQASLVGLALPFSRFVLVAVIENVVDDLEDVEEDEMQDDEESGVL